MYSIPTVSPSHMAVMAVYTDAFGTRVAAVVAGEKVKRSA
jgi:hypothetical protein